MARLIDLKTLAARERELRDQLRGLKKQARSIERAERNARLQRIAELADKFKIAHIQDTVLAAEFKRIAAEHPVPVATESPVDDTAEAGAATQTPARDAVAQVDPETERATETAEVGGETKRWKWK